jgi:RNA polymerase sigma factor (sigma-70 family)
MTLPEVAQAQHLEMLCRQAVMEVAQQERWRLSPAGHDALAAAILPFVTQAPDVDLRMAQRIALNYYLDGPMVQQMAERRTVDGDRLWREWRVYILSLARSKGLAEEEAEELAQEVYVQTARALQTFRFGSRLKTYFFGIFLNCYRRWVRTAVTETQREQPLEDDHDDEDGGNGPQFVDPGATPEQEALAGDHHSRLRELVRQEVQKIIHSEDFQILYWYYVEKSYVDAATNDSVKWTDKVIGERLGMPLNTVTSRRIRALQRLQRNAHLRALFAEALAGE